MRRFILSFLLSIFFGTVLAQSPKSLDHALSILDKSCSDSLKKRIQITENDELTNLFYPWDGGNKTLMEFTSSDKKTRYEKYFEKKGIVYESNIETITLIAYKRKLNKLPIKFDSLLLRFQNVELRWLYEDENKYEVDSIRRIYIPKDLYDCIRQIDSFWNDSVKNQLKQMTSRDFGARLHLGFGMWMRNNWRLWGGSRLSKYFNSKGVRHPDNMSGIILAAYHKHLQGIEIIESEFFSKPETKD